MEELSIRTGNGVLIRSCSVCRSGVSVAYAAFPHSATPLQGSGEKVYPVQKII